ncbi:MAG: hypothetical protein V3T21_06900, partial [Candidatus Margulisiibacteriota bacterium]
MVDFSAPIANLDEIQEKEAIAYEGSIQPNYIQSNEEIEKVDPSVDASEISSSSSSTGSKPASGAETEDISEDSSNYIDNQDDSSEGADDS